MLRSLRPEAKMACMPIHIFMGTLINYYLITWSPVICLWALSEGEAALKRVVRVYYMVTCNCRWAG